MATLEELQRQVETLQQRVDTLTTPPTDYYTHRWSGEEIDRGIDRAREGGALDAALSNKAEIEQAVWSPELAGQGQSIVLQPPQNAPDATRKPIKIRTFFDQRGDPSLQIIFGDKYAALPLLDQSTSGTLIATATPPQEYDLPLVDGWTVIPGHAAIYSKNQFDQITIVLGLSTTELQMSEKPVFTLPVGFRPSKSVTASVTFWSASTGAHASVLVLSADGQCILFHQVGVGESGNLHGAFTFQCSD